MSQVEATTTIERGDKQGILRTQLAERIAGMRPGEPLPAERDLSAELGVARMTLRRALDTLVADGVLTRRRGAGTFVSPSRFDQRLAATSFSQDMRARGLVPGASTLASRSVPAGLALASVLGTSPHEQLLHVRRLRTANGIPMAVEDLHMPSSVAPGLTGPALQDRSFYEVLAGYGVQVAAGTQTVEPHLTSAEESACLEVEPGSLAFLFERTSTDADGRVIEFVRSVYRGDRYRLVVDIFPSPATRGHAPPERTPHP